MSSYSSAFGFYPWRVHTKDKIVALTFDDGPNEPYTSQILDILKSAEIKATFFQVGICVNRYPNVSKRVVKEGHIIGNHSLSHEFHKQIFHPGFEKEIAKTQNIIKAVTGKTPALFRSPWLWRQPLLFKTLKKYNLQIISGIFCHPLEVLQIDGSRIAIETLKRVKPGTILIFHDGHDSKTGNRDQTVKAVQLVIDALRKEQYRFVTVDKLLDIKAYN